MAILDEVTKNECIIHSHLSNIDSLSDSVTHVHYVVLFADLKDGTAVCTADCTPVLICI